jgi:hypothetical protein
MIKLNIITNKLNETNDEDFKGIELENHSDYATSAIHFCESAHGREEYKNCVWVIGTDHNFKNEEHQEVFVTSDLIRLRGIIEVDLMDVKSYEEENGVVSVYIHRYDSFDMAYRTALDMREGRKNCYEDEN